MHSAADVINVVRRQNRIPDIIYVISRMFAQKIIQIHSRLTSCLVESKFVRNKEATSFENRAPVVLQ